MSYGTNAPQGLMPMSSITGGSWTEKVNEYYIYASADGTSTYQNPIFTGDPVVWGTSFGTAPVVNGLIGTIAIYFPNFTNGTPTQFSSVPILGVFVGCEYLSTVTGTNNLIKSAYWPGAAQVIPGSVIKAYVIDDPNVVYDIQVSTNRNATANAFVGNPVFPNTNATAGAPFHLAGTFGRNFALNVGGGTNFNTVVNSYTTATGNTYANNPATGSTLTGQSAFYLDVDTSTTAGYDAHDYNKDVVELPVRALGYTRNPNNVAAPTLTLQTTPFLNVMVTINNPVYAISSLPTVYVA